MHIPETKLKDILITNGIVNEEEFQAVKATSVRLGQGLIDVLIGRGDVTEAYLVEILEPVFGSSLVRLKEVNIPFELLTKIPEGLAKSKHVIAYEEDKENGVLKVAMADPLDLETIEYLRQKLNVWIEPHLATFADIRHGLKQYKKKIGEEFNEIIDQNVREFLPNTAEGDVSKLAAALPVVTILDSIIENAIAMNASDIHFEPLDKNLLVRYRIDGVLQEIVTLHKVIESILVARVKILSDLQIDEHRVPQDGRFRFEIEEGSVVDVRVNVMPTMHGEKVEMRLLKTANRPFTFEELGLSPAAIAIVNNEIHKPHGMVLVTGPTGHGKTTTLYAILHMLNTAKVNITTIEDPIEYEISRVNQTQVNTKAGVTFANGLRSLMRQNPDIILIGEIRDNETVEIAVHAALTGHLVLSSLHTNDAPSALPRLLDMGAQAFLLSSTVNVIIAQRLVRKICSACVLSYKISEEQKNLVREILVSTVHEKVVSIPETLYKGRGCKICSHSGFVGQIGIYEVLKVDEVVRELVLKSVSSDEIRKKAIADGMITMFEDGLLKVERGITTMEEILRVVRE